MLLLGVAAVSCFGSFIGMAVISAQRVFIIIDVVLNPRTKVGIAERGVEPFIVRGGSILNRINN